MRKALIALWTGSVFGQAQVLSLPIAQALEEELGLRLDRVRGPVEMLVVDPVQKVPTDN